jgi:hypothetical protein
VVALLLVVGMLVWAGATLLIDAWLGRDPRIDLAQRLDPHQTTVGDEAEAWLGRHQPPVID